jgi:hypothetical protein
VLDYHAIEYTSDAHELHVTMRYTLSKDGYVGYLVSCSLILYVSVVLSC